MIRTNNNNIMNPIRSILRALYVLVFCGTILSNTRVNTVRFASASSTTSISSAVQALQKLDTRYFIAGGTCAAISHGITTPIDVIKTKIQSNPKKFHNRGLIGSAIDIINEDGIASLGNGLGPTVLGYGIEGALKFGIYEIMKQLFVEILGTSSSKGIAFLLASIVAGGVAAIVLCPMESTRIKMVTDPSYQKLNLLTAFAKMFHEEGLLTSFAGIYAMLSKQVPYTFGKQVTFDVFASRLYTLLDTIRDTDYGSIIPESYRKWIVSIVAAFGASLVACIFSQPGDMILTETYHSSGGHGHGGHTPSVPPSKPTKNTKKKTKVVAVVVPSQQQQQQRSFIEIISSIYQSGGYPAFFTGTGARIVHVGLIITSQLVIYDIVKQLLGLPATGSH